MTTGEFIEDISGCIDFSVCGIDFKLYEKIVNVEFYGPLYNQFTYREKDNGELFTKYVYKHYENMSVDNLEITITVFISELNHSRRSIQLDGKLGNLKMFHNLQYWIPDYRGDQYEIVAEYIHYLKNELVMAAFCGLYEKKTTLLTPEISRIYNENIRSNHY